MVWPVQNFAPCAACRCSRWDWMNSFWSPSPEKTCRTGNVQPPADPKVTTVQPYNPFLQYDEKIRCICLLVYDFLSPKRKAASPHSCWVPVLHPWAAPVEVEMSDHFGSPNCSVMPGICRKTPFQSQCFRFIDCFLQLAELISKKTPNCVHPGPAPRLFGYIWTLPFWLLWFARVVGGQAHATACHISRALPVGSAWDVLHLGS